jgi:glycosyltransferase involved in cell wall biosynthesis
VSTPDEDEFTVLYVGQISFRKGLPYLIEAFSKLRHPRKRLRLIGAIEQQIRPYLQTAPLDRVVFEGSKGIDEIRMAMSSSHVLVLPSVEDGFGMVMAEAMACGSPIISSVHTGGLDLFDDGKEGFHVPIRNSLALCTALQRLADNPALRKEMSAAALDKMQKLGGWKQYGNVVEDFLLQLKVLSQRAVHA